MDLAQTMVWLRHGASDAEETPKATRIHDDRRDAKGACDSFFFEALSVERQPRSGLHLDSRNDALTAKLSAEQAESSWAAR